MGMVITTMIMSTSMTMDTATAILIVMGILIRTDMAGMSIITTMEMNTTIIMRTMTMCIMKLARRITARALPACMCPA